PPWTDGVAHVRAHRLFGGNDRGLEQGGGAQAGTVSYGMRVVKNDSGVPESNGGDGDWGNRRQHGAVPYQWTLGLVDGSLSRQQSECRQAQTGEDPPWGALVEAGLAGGRLGRGQAERLLSFGAVPSPGSPQRQEEGHHRRVPFDADRGLLHPPEASAL